MARSNCRCRRSRSPRERSRNIHLADEPSNFIYPRSYLGLEHTSDLIIVQITFNEGRTTAQKKALYQGIAQRLHDAIGIRLEDVFINLVEVKKENWSFGGGVAQYAEP